MIKRIILFGILIALICGFIFIVKIKTKKTKPPLLEWHIQIVYALEHYKEDNGLYPTTEQGLKALLQKATQPPIPQKWKGPYCINRQLIKEDAFIDPWGSKYQYKSPGFHNPESYDLCSFGPDGKESDDDIILGNSNLGDTISTPENPKDGN